MNCAARVLALQRGQHGPAELLQCSGSPGRSKENSQHRYVSVSGHEPEDRYGVLAVCAVEDQGVAVHVSKRQVLQKRSYGIGIGCRGCRCRATDRHELAAPPVAEPGCRGPTKTLFDNTRVRLPAP